LRQRRRKEWAHVDDVSWEARLGLVDEKGRRVESEVGVRFKERLR
jgi:hypothetical protein